MDTKPKKKWTSSRLKEKKKELGIEDDESCADKSVDSEVNKFVKKVVKKEFEKPRNDKKFSKDRNKRNYDKNAEKYVIKVSNLPRDITVQELNELISPWGEIGNINIKTYSEVICSYIDFYKKDQAEYFIKAIDSTPFDSMIINAQLMDFSKSKE